MMVTAFDRRITTRITFAVLLIDDYTGKKLSASTVKVSVPEYERDALENPSGYHIFCDLPAVVTGAYVVRVASGYYVEKEVTVTLAGLLPEAPVASIALTPSHLYPFSSGATLLRGVVSDTGGGAVSGAQLRWEVNAVTKDTTASEKGEFVLYFPVDYFLPGVETAAIDIQVAPPGGAFTVIHTSVTKCKTASLCVVI